MVLWFYGCMKTTLEVPDDLYALVKAKAALEGRTLRAVMEELLKGWVVGGSGERGAGSETRGGAEEQGARGTDEERGGDERKGGDVEQGARSGERKAGVVAEEAGESYGGTKGDERGPMRTKEDEKGGRGKRGTREGVERERQARAVDPWESHRNHLRRIMLNPRAIDEVAGILKEPGPDLDMAAARKIYEAELAKAWKRRHG
jgi:hypothetical protein